MLSVVVLKRINILLHSVFLFSEANIFVIDIFLIMISFTHQVAVQLFFLIFFLTFWPFFIQLLLNDVLKLDLASLVNARMVCFSAFARSEIFQNNARELGVGTRAILCRDQTGRRQKN